MTIIELLLTYLLLTTTATITINGTYNTTNVNGDNKYGDERCEYE